MIFYLFLLHFVGDFVLQSRYIAENKGKDLVVLCTHVVIYCATFAVGLIFLVEPIKLITFILANFMLHFVTDFCTSKLTTYFWQRNQTKNFFTTIGFDQLLHQVAITATMMTFL